MLAPSEFAPKGLYMELDMAIEAGSGLEYGFRSTVWPLACNGNNEAGA